MFQSFESTADPAQAAPRMARLRALMAEAGLDGVLVPRSDEHQGEYVPPCAERLAWLTGFTGSAGMALVLRDKALLFVDGRYTLQARVQTDPALFEIESLIDNPPRAWMKANLSRGARIGFDPWLHTVGEIRALREALEKPGAQAVPLERNPVDAIWEDRPAPPMKPVRVHPLVYAGETAGDKLSRLAERLRERDIDHTVLTDPSSLAWAFNIRGNDVPHTPLALGFAILSAAERPRVFMAAEKLSGETEDHLRALAALHAPEELEPVLANLARSGARVGLDEAHAAEKLRLVVEEAGGAVVPFADPAALPRAMKNEAELKGARAAHLRDGAALARFLAWLDGQTPENLDEIAVVRHLEECRRRAGQEAQMPLRDISFDTISGAGPNGAIIHYRVTEKTNRKLARGELLLVDSGAQFEDGTTDVTRTVALGEPSLEMKDRFTRVLKGMIAISMLRFPEGTRGVDIDAFARHALWQAGLDYGHGTGHGVGSYLSVHEGPQRIARTGMETLRTGMILSNEPGYYRAGHYGIRIENLIVVTPPEPVPGGDVAMHGFETLTLAPIDRRLVVPGLLTDAERDWLNAYHARVLEEITPLVEGDTAAWLRAATAPL
ncbi:aminopeptidase P family protein [Chelativorans intermedius]|uniref:Aminopeptidase P family protein n=1 Tax=Chelativorans intermedius TaxID=515947 RepID=A0ABV6D3G3_9HYPH|nr:aminopeptidase P family protein [Chelativorans intermedius]MCT8996889.1 aminopeptidase P family protein [Chelativorans intermedius]